MGQKWSSFEDMARDIAGSIFGADVQPKTINGVKLDGYAKLKDGSALFIEATIRKDIAKVREDIAKLNTVRNGAIAEGVFPRSYIILQSEPTAAMHEAAGEHIVCCSINEFGALFFEFERYKTERDRRPFGSTSSLAELPSQEIPYIEVKYKSSNSSTLLTIDDIIKHLINSKNVVLLGEYGSGKSRCIQEIFERLSEDWGSSFVFPFAINLRDCWGLERSQEILRRHILDLGLDELEGRLVTLFNRGSGLFLLDGFDEIGMQSWSTDDTRLRLLRARALTAVKGLITASSQGVLVAGRDHYFSSNEEMLSALGLSESETIIVRAHDEFSEREIEEYFQAAKIDVDLPYWLPRRPLICQVIASLDDDTRASMFGFGSDEVAFWHHLIDKICERDASIHEAFDPATIKQIFVRLSRITRGKSANVGPLTPLEIERAFETVVGSPPVHEASVMLLRLPSLGREGQESQERKFVDAYILDGLRALDIIQFDKYPESEKQDVLDQVWMNPIDTLGQKIAASTIERDTRLFKNLAKRASSSRNRTLAADIFSSCLRTEGDRFDFGGLSISEANFSTVDMSSSIPDGVEISSSIFENIILPSSPPRKTMIVSSVAERVSGATSPSGLPDWIKLDSVDYFDSAETVSRIRSAGLSPAHEILTTIIKKTFFQKGAGRKEEALLRGFGQSASKKLSDKILKILMREDILTTSPGKEGTIYVPNRSQAGRMGKMLQELRSSEDAIWKEVEGL